MENDFLVPDPAPEVMAEVNIRRVGNFSLTRDMFLDKIPIIMPKDAFVLGLHDDFASGGLIVTFSHPKCIPVEPGSLIHRYAPTINDNADFISEIKDMIYELSQSEQADAVTLQRHRCKELLQKSLTFIHPYTMSWPFFTENAPQTG